MAVEIDMIDWVRTESEFGVTVDNFRFDSTVVVICDGCGVFGYKKIRRKGNVVGGQMSWECMKCVNNRPGLKKVQSEKSKETWRKHRDKIVNSIDYAKVSRKSKEKWRDEGYRGKVVASIRRNAPLHSERMKEKWRDEGYRSKMMELYHTEWREDRSRIANQAWEDDDYKNCIIEHNKKKRITKEEFLERACAVYGDRYDYSQIDYKLYSDPVKIICKDHGEFWQVPRSHISSSCGCPLCAGTHLQAEIYGFVSSLNDNVINNDRNMISPSELDILIPDNSLAIEVNGNYWHSYNKVETCEERNRHTYKLEKCAEIGILLIQVAEYEWVNKRQIVESVIRNRLSKSERIYARKCKLRGINIREYRDFVNHNHLQGYRYSHAIYGLEYENGLVAVMSFNKHDKYGWEITRFANKVNTAVVGGASRLFGRFLREVNPDRVLSYADRRYSDGGLYDQLGFELDGITKPNYVYIKGVNSYSRQQFQKHKLKNKLKVFNQNLTEAENMFHNNYRRMWDAGNMRFLWRK